MNYSETLELLIQKNKKGLEVLYSSYGQKFYGYALTKWKLNEDESWEVVYQTLETLVLKLPQYKFKNQAHFDNFIFKVFINFLRQFFRSHRNHQYDIVYVDFNDHEVENLRDDSNVENLIKHLEIEDQEFSNFYNENSIVENSKLSNLQKALESLDPIDRELLLLRAQNYTYDEIAQMMNIENNQLKVKHHRAKTRLLKKIEQ